MIHAEKRGTRIVLHSEEPLRGIKSAIPGAYQAVGGHWTVPLSIETCYLLKSKYDGQLTVGNELKRWSRGVVDNRNQMVELSESDSAKLEYLPKEAPELYRATRKRKYQRVGIRFIADNTATLLADDPGLGKTLQALGGILEAQVPGPYLVVTPKTAVESVWRPEIERWLPSEHRVVTLPEIWEDRDYRLRTTRYGPKTWLVIHPEIVLIASFWECQCGKRTPEGSKQKRKLSCGHMRNEKTKTVHIPRHPKLFEMEWGAVIEDESHESLIVRKGVKTQRRRGLDTLKVRPDGIRLALSGTPFDDKPHQLWGTLNWLDRKQYSAFYRWAQMFWMMGGHGGYEVQDLREDREQLLWNSLSAICLRRTKQEVAKDLPPKMDMGEPLNPSDKDSPIGIWLPMEGEQERAYTEFEERAVTELESGRLESVYAIEELTRLKQLACCYGDVEERKVWVDCDKVPNHGDMFPLCTGYRKHKINKQFYVPKLPSNKFTWIKNQLEEWGYPRHPVSKVVIVSFYSGILREFARGIDQHFKSKLGSPLCTGITGRTPAKIRKNVIDRFNSDGRNTPQIMLLNVRAGGTAITIDSADRMIFISETRKPSQQLQAEDRIHRISNPRQCMYYYLRSKGTVDVGTALLNKELTRQRTRLLDTRRGVEYFREVVRLGRSSHRKN